MVTGAGWLVSVLLLPLHEWSHEYTHFPICSWCARTNLSSDINDDDDDDDDHNNNNNNKYSVVHYPYTYYVEVVNHKLKNSNGHFAASIKVFRLKFLGIFHPFHTFRTYFFI